MKLSLRSVLALAPLVFAASAGGCGVHSDKAIEKTAVDHSTASQRKKSYEATAQLLDEDPALVDELYSVMRLHPKAMDRFLANTSTDLDQKWLAKETGTYLAQNPAGVEEVLDATIPAIQKEPKARAAMNRALAAHADQTADILTDNPDALAKIVKSLLTVTEKKQAARQNLATAIHADREAILAFVKQDKALAREIAVDVIKEAIKDKPTLDMVLSKTGALDAPEGAPTPAPPPAGSVRAKTIPAK